MAPALARRLVIKLEYARYRPAVHACRRCAGAMTPYLCAFTFAGVAATPAVTFLITCTADVAVGLTLISPAPSIPDNLP